MITQLDKIREKGITNSQIICAVAYWYEIKGNSKKDFEKYGFGIVSSVYEEAESYFKRIKSEQERKRKQLQTALSTPPQKVLVTSSPKRKVERRINSIEHEDWECKFRK